MLTLPEHGSLGKSCLLKNSIAFPNWRERGGGALVKLPGGLGMIRPVMQSGPRTMILFEPSKSRRFSVRIEAPGPRFPCLGVYLAGSLTDNC